MFKLPTARRSELLQMVFWLFLLSDIVLLDVWNLMLPSATLLALFLFLFAGSIWLFVWFRNPANVSRSPFDVSFVLLAAVIAASSMNALDPSRSWRVAWLWLALMVLFQIALTVFRNGWTRTAFSKALLLVTAISLIGAYFQLYLWLSSWYKAGPWPDLLPPTFPRIWGLSVGPNVLQATLNFGVLIGMGYWHTFKGRRPLPLYVWFILVLPMLILPRSRGGWLALLVGGAIFYGLPLLSQLRAGQIKNRRLLIYLGSVVVSVVGLILLITLLRGETLSLQRLGSALYRTNFWQVAIAMWRVQPVWGTGLNTYATFHMLMYPTPYESLYVTAHSIYFQTLGELGLMGLALVLLINGQVCYLIGKGIATNQTPLRNGAIAALAAFQVHAVFDTPKHWLMALAVCLLAWLVADLQKARSETNRRLRFVWPLLWLILLSTGYRGYLVGHAYQQGIELSQDSAWQAGLDRLKAGQAISNFEDSSLLAAEALLNGMLAFRDPAYLTTSIAQFEQLVALEPGWTTHRANLASLLWTAGERERAIQMMQEVVDQAPAVAVFRLNLMLWQQETDQVDRQNLQALYDLPDVWPDAPLWEPYKSGLNNTAHGIQTVEIPEWETNLNSFEWMLVEQEFVQAAAETPYDAGLYLEWLKAAMYFAQYEEVPYLLRKINALEAIASARGRGGLGSSHAAMWQSAIPDKAPKALEQFEMRMREQSAYGPGRGGQGIYTIMVMSRMPPPADLLPQLQCFAVTNSWAIALLELQAWYEAREIAEQGAWIDRLLMGSGNGTVSCWQGVP